MITTASFFLTHSIAPVQLILSGAFGLFLVCCCRKQYPGMRGGCCVFVVRVQYIVSAASVCY